MIHNVIMMLMLGCAYYGANSMLNWLIDWGIYVE